MRMNLIQRIKIENIKGKSCFEASFTNFTANQPNIVVAPNGYGKSTIATAFKAAQHGKLKLDPRDIYQQDSDNHPKLEIELLGDHAGIYMASDTESNISTNIFLGVINSPLYAKSTTRHYGARTASTADLRIEDVMVYPSIPERRSIDYSYNQIKRDFGSKGKLFLNISEMLSIYGNIELILTIKENLNKCIIQTRIQSSFRDFLNQCPNCGTTDQIKRAIPLDRIAALRNNDNVAALFDCINEMEHKPSEWQPIDVVFTAIQICKVIGHRYDAGDRDIIKKVHAYLEYKAVRDIIDNRLADFNTTGRTIRTREDHGKLIVGFERADSLSNGERDILSFVVNITKFELLFKKTVGILIIDEVFDYLDGSNMLAVQYYLIELIKSCKSKGKVLFPIIFTHLDPAVFANYYFQKKKIHYISLSAPIELGSDLVKMLRLRESGTLCDEDKQEIEKYYLHYVNENHSLNAELAQKVALNFSDSNISFRTKLYAEITEKYLSEVTYNPVMVIAGLRIKIEEVIYQKLAPEDREAYIAQHKVINKLNYAVAQGVDVPELFFLLQPLYNDGLHLGGNDDVVRSKIKSSYLKTNNLHIKRMIKELFN